MKILIIGPAWVGDMVMAQTLFICLKQQNPAVEIDVLAPNWTQALLARMPEVSCAINMPVGHGRVDIGVRRKLALSLRDEKYQQAIVLPNSFKSALIPLWAKIPLRTGWRGEARSWILNDTRILNKKLYPKMQQRFAALAFPKESALPKTLPNPSLRIKDGVIPVLQEKFSIDMLRPVLVICPGAEFGVSKQWPGEYFAEVAADRIHKGWEVWTLGSDKDISTGEAIGALLSTKYKQYYKNLAGKSSLEEAIDLISLASTVVSNDSGLMHIAAALAKPLVVIYGSTSPEFTPPLAKQVKMLSLTLECRPCFKRECPLQHLRCLKEIKPLQVITAVKELC